MKDEKLSYFCGSQKNPSFMGGEGVHEKPLYRQDCLKRGALTICRFKGGILARKRMVVFLRG